MNLKDKIAVVTGGSRGIGRAIALRLARDGALVCVNYRGNAEAASETVKAIESADGEGFALQGDVGSVEQIGRFFQALDAELTRRRGDQNFDILVNNAGMGDGSSLEATTEDQFDRVFATNVKGPFFTTQHALTRLRDGGRVISVSSNLSRHPMPSFLPYCMTKAAINNFTEGLAGDLGRRGITVNTLAPGLTATDMTAAMREQPGVTESFAAMTALGRVGTVEDIAGRRRVPGLARRRLGDRNVHRGQRRTRPGHAERLIEAGSNRESDQILQTKAEPTMRYRLLGNSGLRVSELCLGTMTFGEDWGWGSSKDESRAILDAFLEAGGNFIDTANVYTNGTSETLLGEFLRGDRDRVVLATKYTNTMPGSDPNAGGNQRKNMMRSVEASLKRLGTDYIDLYWLHIWDKITPIDEVMRAFDDLVRAGKILYAGVSDMPAWVIARGNTLAELRGWTSFVGLQVEYSLVERAVERELLPMAQAMGLGVTAWSPLGGGVLTGKYLKENGKGGSSGENRLDSEMMKNFAPDYGQTEGVVREVVKVAEEVGRSPAQVALAWLNHRPIPVIPIVGARKLAQFQDNLASLEVKLDPAQVARLDAAGKVKLGFPHDFYENGMVKESGLRRAASTRLTPDPRIGHVRGRSPARRQTRAAIGEAEPGQDRHGSARRVGNEGVGVDPQIVINRGKYVLIMGRRG